MEINAGSSYAGKDKRAAACCGTEGKIIHALNVKSAGSIAIVNARHTRNSMKYASSTGQRRLRYRESMRLFTMELPEDMLMQNNSSHVPKSGSMKRSGSIKALK